jgi:hypothetical protein
MGGSSSKVKQLNEAITDITSKALVKVSSQCSGNISQTQHVKVGKGSSLKRFSMDQYAELDLSCLQNAGISNDLQVDLVTTMMNEATNASSQFPAQLSKADNATEIENIMRTNLALELNQEALAGMQLGLTQEQKVRIGSGTHVEDVSLTQHAEAVAKLVNNLSGAVKGALMQGTEFKNTVEQKQTNFMTDVLDSMGNTLTGLVDTMSDSVSSVWTFSDNMTIMVVVGVIVLGISGYFAASAASG